VGVELVKNLMVDAKTTSRWYLIVAMGRKAGHLALGIGKAAGATLTIIPEEFGSGSIRLDHVVDVLAGAIIKRKSLGHDDGTAILAEGLVEQLEPHDLEMFGELQRDEHDHVRLAEVNLGDVVKDRLRQRLGQLGLSSQLVTKDIGYELRCADPIPFDMEYTRDLGFCAAQYLLDGGTDAMVMLVDGRFKPQPFSEMLDPRTGRTRVRLVDVQSEQYQIARRYMVRLRPEDLSEADSLDALAAVVNQSPDEFLRQFGYLVDAPAREAMPLTA
jgi:6-phosphofructokinase 1